MIRILPFTLACALIAGCTGSPPAPDPVWIEAEQVGFLFRDISSGENVSERRADDVFIPASTAKIITAVAARNALAPGFRFVTRLCASVPPDADGIIPGDLVLIGSGDPTFDMDDLLALALSAHEAGIRQVSGDLIVDDTAMLRTDEIEPGQPENAAYNPGISALTVAENARRVERRADGRAWFVPDIEDEVSPSSMLDGDIAPEGRKWLPVRDGGLRTGKLFETMAKNLGIIAPSPVRRRAGCGHEIAHIESAKRDEVIAEVLETSSNPMAELLGIRTAIERGGNPKTLRDAASATEGWLRDRLPSTDWSGLVLPNHSGLSAKARITPRQMVDILAYAYSRRNTGSRPFPALLTPAGWGGHLGKRLNDRSTAMKLWAKTGTMHYGVGLVGYLFAGDGEVYAFAVYVSDDAARDTYDKVAGDPDEITEDRALQWDDTARNLIDGLLVRFARTGQALP